MKSGPTKRGTGNIMLEFFRKLFKKDKSGSGLTQIKYDTQQDWQKRIIRAKEKPKIPRIDWKIRSLPRRRITIIAVIAGASLGIWFGVQYYQSPLAMYSLNVARNPEDGGNVSAFCAGITSPIHANYRDGTDITLVATPSPGYEFVSWSGDASGTSPSTTITMDSDKTITARFDTIAQYIDYTMKAGEISGSVISFSKVLDRGEKIQGYVELTGEYKTRDRTFRWNFEIINPEGRPEDIFRGHWVNETYHEFDLKAVYKGEYQIKIDHNSRYDLHLVIEIIPKGWQSSKPQ